MTNRFIERDELVEKRFIVHTLCSDYTSHVESEHVENVDVVCLGLVEFVQTEAQ